MLPMPLVIAISLPRASATWSSMDLASRYGAMQLTVSMSAQARPSSALSPSSGVIVPALAISRSSGPLMPSASRTTASRSRRSSISIRTPSASSSAEGSRAVAVTVQPLAEYCRANSRPMPRLAPVTRTLGIGRRVMVGAEEMQRHIRLVADHPAVVAGRDVKEVAGAHLDHPAVVHRRRRAARHDHSDMLDQARLLAERSADMDRPFPPRLIGRPADDHLAHVDQLEPPELELAHLVGRLEPLEDDVELHPSRTGWRRSPRRRSGGSLRRAAGRWSAGGSCPLWDRARRCRSNR